MRRLAPAALLAALPALARAADMMPVDLTDILVPIGVVGTVFGFSALIVGIVFYAVHRDNRLRHETIRMALEKGQPLPPELLDPVKQHDPIMRDLRRGLILLGVGLGVGLFLAFSPVAGAHRQWAVGFVPGIMGLAYLAAYAVARRQARSAQAAAE